MNLFKENRLVFQETPEQRRRRLAAARQRANQLAGSGTFEGQTSTQLAQTLDPGAPKKRTATTKATPLSGGKILTPQQLKESRAEAFSPTRAPSLSAEERGATIVPDKPFQAQKPSEIREELGLQPDLLTPLDELKQEKIKREDILAEQTARAEKKKSRIGLQLEAAKAAAASRFAESPEGVQTSTAPGAAERATSGAEFQAQQLRTQITDSLENLRQLNIQASEAAARGESDRQQKIERTAAEIQQKLKDQEAELEASGAAASEDVLKLFEGLDQPQLEGLANLDADAFAATIQAINPALTGLRAAGLQMLAKQLSTLDPESLDFQKKQLEIQKLQAELAGGLPDKAVATLQRLRDSGTITQAQFDKALEEELGIREEPASTLDKLKEEELRIENAIAREELSEFSDDDVVGQRYSSVVTGEGNAGVVTQDYAATSSVTSDNRDVLMLDGSTKKGTPGVDLDGRIGDPIFSTISGVVVDDKDLLSDGDKTGLGTRVAIQDPEGNVHFFNHMSATELEVGDDVFSGDEIGKIGNSGTVIKGETGDGSHLDYRTQDTDKQWIDPRQFIDEFTDKAQEGKTLREEFVQQAKDAGIKSKKKQQEFADDRIKEAFKSPTEVQGKALKALITAQAENELFNTIVQDIDPEEFADAVNFLSKKIGDPDTLLTGEIVNRHIKDARVRQAIMSSLRWTAAVLREESGAAISIAEYLSKGIQFFPTAGDDPVTIQQKSDARIREERGLKGKIGASGERQLREIEEEREADPKVQETRLEKLDRFQKEREINVTEEDEEEIGLTFFSNLIEANKKANEPEIN